MFFVGIDVHQRQSSLCILDSRGKTVKELTVIGNWERLLEELKKLPRPMAVCFEASTGCGWLYERIKPIARRVEVAHPGQVRLIFRSKKKHDRIDAKKLATLLFLDQVPRAYIPDASVRSWRALIEFRCATVEKRTAVKNALRTLMRSCGVLDLHPGKGLWARKGLDLLRQIGLSSPCDGLRRELLMGQLDQCNLQVKAVEKELDKLAEDRPEVALLQSIPGVGIRTAEAVAAYIDKAQRFGRGKQVGAYFGLVPCQDSSASVNRLGHITRQGPPTVRKLLVEAAWQGVRRSSTLGAFYQKVRQGKKERTKIALVATAHHLLLVMEAMLRSGQEWREAKEKAAA